MARNIRDIVETARYAREKANLIAAFSSNDRDFDNLVMTIERAITVEPETSGHATILPEVRVIATDAGVGVPALLLYYSWNDTEVLLGMIRVRGGNGHQEPFEGVVADG